MLEEIRYAYSSRGERFTGVIVEPNPQNGVYVGPIVGRVDLDNNFYGMRDYWIAQALSPERIAIHYHSGLPSGDTDAILWQRGGIHVGRPVKWGQVMRVEYRDGNIISCHSTGSRADNWRQAGPLIIQMKKAFGPRVPEYSLRLTDGAWIGWDDEEVRR